MLDINKQHVPAELQMSGTSGSTDMRPRTFGALKKGQYPKRAQICPIWNFLVIINFSVIYIIIGYQLYQGVDEGQNTVNCMDVFETFERFSKKFL